MTRRFPCLLALIVALAAPAQAQTQKLSLREAVDFALAHNGRARAASEQRNSAEAKRDAAFGKFLPVVDVDFKRTRIDKPIVTDLNPLRSAIIGSHQIAGTDPARLAAMNRLLPSFEITQQKEYFTKAGVNLKQPLFTGGKLLANYDANNLAVDVAEKQAEAVRNGVIVDVVQAYYQVRLAEAVASVRDRVVASMEEQLRVANNGRKAGDLSQAQVMQVEVALSDAKRQALSAKKDRELAAESLRTALGGDGTGEIELTTPFDIKRSREVRASFGAFTSEGNIDLAVLRVRREQLDEQKAALRGRYSPDVFAFGRYELYRKDLTATEPKWAVGIGAQINLFNGLSDASELRSVEHDALAVDATAANAKHAVDTGLRKYTIDLERAEAELASLEATKALARENVRLNGLAFGKGLVTSVETINAELSLAQAELAEKKAIYDFNVALLNLGSLSNKLQPLLAK